MIDHLSFCEIKTWKNSGLNGIQIHDLYDTDAVLYQLSYHWGHLEAGHIVSS